MSFTSSVAAFAAAAFAVAALAALAGSPGVRAQQSQLDRVLAFPAPIPGEELHADRGAAGAWHRIRKLATTASIMHVTAHPDDEHSGMLTLASRGWGARTALLSLNRGEAGANAIGPELFDGLGLIRTRELVLSGRYYGLDDLYFTTAVDYGYSKTVEETFRSWDREAVLEDMVRVLRLNRPIVVVSRFHGSRRDGHGNHHAAGVLTPEAVVAAADPERFPDQIAREGLRPWRVARLYRGGVRAGEPYHVAVDANGYSPSLGMTYQRWASMGLSLQRSQTSGRMRRGGGQVYWYESVAGGEPEAGSRPLEDGFVRQNGPEMADNRDMGGFVGQNGLQVADNFFAGLDTRLTGLPTLLGEDVGAGVAGRLAEVQDVIDGVVRDFDFTAPEASVAGLARGLALLRAVTGEAGVPVETGFHLAVKERQFEDAIMAAAGVEVLAELATEAGGAVVVPGEVVEVAVGVESAIPGRVELAGAHVVVGAGDGWGAGGGADRGDREGAGRGDRGGDAVTISPEGPTEVRIPADAATEGPYFERAGLAENHYRVSDSADLHLPWRRPRFVAGLELLVDDVEVALTRPVVGWVPNLPYGSLARRVEVLPAVSVSVSPAVRIVPRGNVAGARESGRPGGSSGQPAGDAVANAGRAIDVLVRIEAHAPDVSVEGRMEFPAGWTATPASVRHDFRGRGEVAEASFSISPPAAWNGDGLVDAVARATLRGTTREYRTGYRTIEHRDLPLARLRHEARTLVRSVAVAPLDGVTVGYVMGVGDEVPAAIEALGATVRLLGEADLTGAALDGFDAIVVGTRAYAVRRDLVDNNQRLLDYARGGGNLVVLYQTQEFVPGEMAPYPASLPRGAEEVSEEDAPVELLVPDHPLLAGPNRISGADFAGWLEQRGSKFFTEWDPAYTPLVETHDTGQEPQRGIWLTAEVGAGRYGYLALALHRQLPYGVPGAFRILSNVLWPGGSGP